MKHLQRIGFLIILVTFSIVGESQVVLEPIQDVVVTDGEIQYPQPWSGGLNAAQYNKADLDGDGSEELIIYDRSARIYQIYRAENQSYVPANELCVLLPEIPDGWVLFVDYDCDGKKDIFSNGDRGIVVFRNISLDNQPAEWQKVADPLLTTGFTGKINLIANAADVPAITDIDSDGDVDILVYNFAIGGYIRYNKNLSQEMYGHSESLEYEINTRAWGQFEECDCNLFAFSGVTCEDIYNGRITHPGGKALLAFDSDGDGDKDLLVGHEQCIELYFYENMGDADSAYMVDYSNIFPEGTTAANFHIFPAAYFEDMDFDGIKDLVVTPSFEENVEYKINFARSNWFYKNEGVDDHPNFQYQESNIIQKNGIDLGENTDPTLTDLDADGDLDLLVAANGYWNGAVFSGYVTQFQNTGTPEAPEFVKTSDNFLELASLNLINPTIQFVDFNGDNAADLLYTGYELQSFEMKVWMFPNQAGFGEPYVFDINHKFQISLPESASSGDVPTFYDIDMDEYPDLLLGKRNGALEYYKNNSSHSFILENAAFMGIERDFSLERLNAVAIVGDVDGDGQSDLIVSDASGEGRIYFQFQSQMNSEPVYNDLVYNNMLNNEFERIKFDSKSWLATADLFNLGSESIIAGGVRGGIQIFKNNEAGGGGQNPNDLDVSIFPNPLFNSDELNIRTSQDVTVELVSVLGQRMREPFTIKKFTGTILNIGHLQNGPYILRSINDGGDSFSKLFLIHR